MAPVAGSAYTYAYATLGELLAWIIGWDLILEYAMACAVVAASWTKYFNVLLDTTIHWRIPEFLSNDPFSTTGAWCNLPAALITLLVTVVLVIGIRESAGTNALLVGIKVLVVLFVIIVGYSFINTKNWTEIPPTRRITAEQMMIPDEVKAAVPAGSAETVTTQVNALYMIERTRQQMKNENKTEAETEVELNKVRASVADALPKTDEEMAVAKKILKTVEEKAPEKATRKWGMLGYLGVNALLERVDNSVRSPFMPYGLGGIIFGASIVFFAYIGFDSISTHSEEAIRPQRDVPIAILTSLVLCTILYIGVAGTITGMIPYPEISQEAAVAAAFQQKAQLNNVWYLHYAALFISIGAVAGMTSVLLITFLSQARIFLAMARDRLLPPSIFGAIHPKFRTPHISTILTGVTITFVSALTPISALEEMVNIGTLMAFVIVCAAVMLLRIQQPNANRPFRCPWIFFMAPMGIAVNLLMMLFLPPETWARLVIWLAIGLLIYFFYGMHNSPIGLQLRGKPVPPLPDHLVNLPLAGH